MEPKIIIHGGFFSESSATAQMKTAKQNAMRDIAEKAFLFLKEHTAEETVVYAVSLLEDCDLFNAGIGSQIQRDGKIRLSASVMDGDTGIFSGVINIEEVKNPVQVARKLMEYDDRVLCGPPAQEFARMAGFEYFDPVTAQRKSEYLSKLEGTAGMGTVGCVALDRRGALAAATSTGGKGFELPGRVSDSATVAGNYANRYAGVSCTGIGEDIVNAALAAKIVTRVSDGLSLKEAFDRSMDELASSGGFAGAIGISASGEVWHAESHPQMVWASGSGEIKVFS